MGVYTEEDVFRDCSRDKKQLTRSEERVYKAVWLALCKWIVERFDKGKGIDLPTIMQLTWMPDVLEEEGMMFGNGSVLKPVWRMAAGFEKANGLGYRHKIDRRRDQDCLLFVKPEEINFHKIAAKYSNKLSQETCFSALRDMFNRIGRVMFEGKDVKIFFGVGDLCAHDRLVHFGFDTTYLRYQKRGDTPGTAMSSRPYTGAGGGRPQTSAGLSTTSEMLIIEHSPTHDSENKNPTEFTNPSKRLGTAQSRPATSASMRVGAAAFYQGVPMDESWKTQRIRDRMERIRVENDKLHMLRNKELERTADIETKNMLLGEQRRVAGELEQEHKNAMAKKKRYEHAQAQRDELVKREQHKRSRRLEQMKNEEDPFFVHLEPQREKVEREKKSAQTAFRSGLEEQIANRLKSAQSDKARLLQSDHEWLEAGQKILRHTLIKDEITKNKKDVQLKGDWAKQLELKEKERYFESTVNKCLTDKISLPFQEVQSTCVYQVSCACLSDHMFAFVMSKETTM